MTPALLQSPLQSFGIENPHITEIPGRAHQTWKVKSSLGVHVLKQYSNTDLQSLKKFTHLHQRLVAEKIPIPAFMVNTSGNPITEYEEKLYVLTTFVDGLPLSAPAIELPLLKQAAATLGLLHRLNQNIYQDCLTKIDFSKTTKTVFELIPQFQKKYALLLHSHPNQSEKLQQLLSIISATEPLRRQYDSPHFDSPWGFIHGDYTPDNVLFERKSGNLFIIDWDNAKIAPRAFEIHKAIGAFCGLAPLNAYLVPIDWKKAKIFLRAYHTINPLTEEVINEIITSAAYGSSTYWLRYTLLQALAEDFRMLDLLPETIEDCLFWKDNLDKYRRLLLSLL